MRQKKIPSFFLIAISMLPCSHGADVNSEEGDHDEHKTAIASAWLPPFGRPDSELKDFSLTT